MSKSRSQKQSCTQGNTLFSYFSKTPKKETNADKEILSPHRFPNNTTQSSPRSTQTNKLESKSSAQTKISPAKSKISNSLSTLSGNDTEYKCGDLVWARLTGYPWWPSLVCNHPTAKTQVRGGKKKEIHVQFFDTPPTRAWVKLSNVKPFRGTQDKECQKGGQFFSLNTKVKKPAEEADKALILTREERLKLVVSLLPSDSEHENSDAEVMDLDPNIFDADMSDENESIKENQSDEKSEMDIKPEIVTPMKKETPSPKKRTRGAGQSAGKPKRRRIIEPDSAEEDSGDDFKPDSSDYDDDDSVSSGVDENGCSETEESEPESPVKNNKRKRKVTLNEVKKTPRLSSVSPCGNKSPFQPSVGSATKSKLSLFSAPETVSPGESGQTDPSNLPHVKLEFLQPDKMRDANKKGKDDPDYDTRTLYVPESFLSKQTPGMRQWWEMKSKHFDTVLFFKMGKFYELFHMDATIGVEELGLIYMKGESAHSGFPEIAYNRYADALVQKGYKVARVEQTETPEMMAERCKQLARASTKFDKVVRREVCQVTTQGTRTFSPRDGDVGDAQATYLMALCEVEAVQGNLTYGVCFVDTSIGTFRLGQFTDDRHCSRLRTVLSHYTPAQILYERGKMSQKTMTIINSHTSALKDALSSGKEFWDSSKTLKTLVEENYFVEEGEEFQWPETLKKMISDSDSLGLSAADKYDLAIRSLGAVIWYLQYCLLDHEVLSMKKFEEYQPLDKISVKKSKSFFDSTQRNLVLDGVSLCNLEVLENAVTGGTEGTLLEQLDTCSTPFGKRLLKQWLCAPLFSPASINDRLNAVEDLIAMQEITAEVTESLKKIPDLERLLSRIHTLGSAKRSLNHPDGRAIFYEETTYSKRKIEDFLSAIGGFKQAMEIAKMFAKTSDTYRSKLLKMTVLLDSKSQEGRFPDITEDLEFFDKAFDHSKAKRDGVIVPSKGVDKDYDKAVIDMRQIEEQLQNYLEKQRQRLGCKAIVYWGTGKNRYQMEIPEGAVKHVPEDYEVMSSKKGAKRYRTKDIDSLLVDLTDAEERKDSALKDIMRRIFHTFDERYNKWSTLVSYLAILDVLLALARYTSYNDSIMSRPELLLPDEETTPFLEIREGRHPCISQTFIGGDFIPNDTVIGVKDETDAASRVVMVTGPNMGGKSTLMRQTGLIVILAQLGCYVPAQKCRLTPVDRIFTRLGASDRIMSGESTFFVELSETSAILQHATEHSLVLMDELGRGTATYDGTAIACSVVQELSEKLCCRSLFSTHYHSLVDQFAHDANIRTGHMACMVENEDEGDPSQETITFLYKFVKGACPKSYGFNAARLANIPEDVISCAVKKAREFESTVEQLHLLRELWNASSMETLKNSLQKLHNVCL